MSVGHGRRQVDPQPPPLETARGCKGIASPCSHHGAIGRLRSHHHANLKAQNHSSVRLPTIAKKMPRRALPNSSLRIICT